MAGVNSQPAKGGRQKMTAPGAMTTERWVAVIVIVALLLLILIRMGFRGVNVAGMSVGVS